jgi:hypothetical protein
MGWREDLKHRTSELPPGSVRGMPGAYFVLVLFFPCKVILFLRRMLYIDRVKRHNKRGVLEPDFFACCGVSFALTRLS